MKIEKTRTIAAAAAFAVVVGVGVLVSGFVRAEPPVIPGLLLREDLNGLDGQEVIMQSLMLAPGGSIPWHKHPDGHEISYVAEGTATLEIEGQSARVLKPGDAFHIQPGVVHRGSNDGSAPVKLLIVRVTAKGKPLMVPAQK